MSYPSEPRIFSDSAATPEWYALTTTETIRQLDSSEQGLSSAEAQARLDRFGPNQITRKKGDSVLKLLWSQINNPLIWVLLASGGLAMIIGKITDGSVVLAVVLINAIIGFIQEFKAGKAIEALSDMVPRMATVLRDGHLCTIAATGLAPGDVVQLAAGDSVPADMRLLACTNLRAGEAALTGESVPVEKNIGPLAPGTVLGDRSCMAYSGTLISAGTGTGIVVATGLRTELGRISDMLEQTIDLQTPLTKKLAEVSTWITIAVVIISAIILTVGLYRAVDQGIPLNQALQETLIFAIALAVGAIPEGLPAVVTIALAIGVRRMAHRNAIIRKLPAVETLGSTTVICSDKTGTLTCNEMTVTEVLTVQGACQVSGIGYGIEGCFTHAEQPMEAVPADMLDLLTAAALCNDASLSHDAADNSKISGDPTEAALLVAAAKAGLDANVLKETYPRLDELPFTSENQYMATLHGLSDGGGRLVLKGAPELVLKRCRLEPDVFRYMTGEMNRMGEQGMRVLALASRDFAANAPSRLQPGDMEEGFLFLGLIGMIDPPREEALNAITACHRAGIVVKMITGDHRATAQAIGAELGLAGAGKVLTGVDLATMGEETLRRAAVETNIFARVAPEHKLALVRALQKEGHVVAMTGDGVNDAPSLKQANIGVAMGITGTAVSRESADIVLADDNFASITAAVEEGRRVYDNLVKSLAFLLPTNLGLALILIWGIMFFPFDPLTQTLLLPMLPSQLLWINLVAAVALALPLAFEVQEPNIMRRPPRRPDAPLFTGFVIFRVISVSVLMTVGTVVLFSLAHRNALDAGLADTLALAQAQTMAVTFVILFQIFYMIHCRSLKENILKIGFFSNPAVFVGAGIVLALQLLFIYLPIMQRIFKTAPLSPQDLALTAATAFVIIPIISLEKKLRSLRDADA